MKVNKLEGIEVIDLKVNVDDRGILYELFRIDFFEVIDAMCKSGHSNKVDWIKQVYLVQNHEESIRAFHRHQKLIDFFCVVRGVAKFIFMKESDKKEATYNYQVVNVCDKKPQLIIVPVGIYHGWKGSKDCIMVSVASELYKGPGQKSELDEERISWDTLGKEIWETEFK